MKNIFNSANKFYLLSMAAYEDAVGQNYKEISNISNSLNYNIDLAIEEYSKNKLTLVRNHLGNLDRSLQQMSAVVSEFVKNEYRVKDAGFFDFFKKKPKEISFEEKHKDAISSMRAGIWNTIKSARIILNKIQNTVYNLNSIDKEDYKSKLLAIKQLCEDYHKLFVDANKEYFIPLLNIKSTVEYQGSAPIEPVDYKGQAGVSTPATLVQPGKELSTNVFLKNKSMPLSGGVGEEYRFAECPCGSGKSFVGCHGEDFDKIKSIILTNKRKELTNKFMASGRNEDEIDDIMKHYANEDNEFWTEAKPGTTEYKDFTKAEMAYFRYLNSQAAKKAEKEAAIQAAMEEQKRKETVTVRNDRRSKMRDFYDDVFGRKAVGRKAV